MKQQKVRLFVDASSESLEAQRILEQEGIPFEAIPSSGPDVPGASYGTELPTGLDEIRVFASRLRHAD